MIKSNPYSQLPWPLYAYLLKNYVTFLIAGKCLSYPRVIQIQTQSRCNARCSICPYRTTSKLVGHGEMNCELFSKIADEIAAGRKHPMIIFALHNEPLLDKRIFSWIKQLKSGNPGCYCVLPTNGELLDQFSLEEIEQSGVDQININLGAFSKETYEKVHTGLDYSRVTKNVSRLLNNENLRQKVQIMFVLNKENAREAQQALIYWKQRNVPVKLTRINNRAGSLDTFPAMNLDSPPLSGSIFLRGWKNSMSAARKSIGCELPFYQMNILFNGDVLICCYDWKRSVVIGNIRTSSLRAMWNSSKMTQIRRTLLQQNLARIPSCKDCSR
jgi:radical SAM protein with 4Fe4S-binding SPASM domain